MVNAQKSNLVTLKSILRDYQGFVQHYRYDLHPLRDNNFSKVSWRLGKNCRFFTKGQFLAVSYFFQSDFTFNRTVRLIEIREYLER